MTVLLAALALAAPYHEPPADCAKTFTAPMITRAIDAAYHGTRDVTRRDRRHLRRYLRCGRMHVNHARMHRYWRDAIHAWELRRNPPLSEALASWYDDAGQTACGFHATYGFANLSLPCGAHVLMRGPGGEVVATMQDHGPYVGGRLFDLNPSLKNALGCGDLCTIGYRVLP
jgi:rare lipoprotein A (peptidoglycan hydrolase)